MLASILPTLPSMPNVERLLSVLPPCQDMQLGPTRDTCAVCDNGVLEPSQCFTTAPLISAKGLVKQVQLFKRRCSCCHADHYLSYAAGGLRLQRGEQVFRIQIPDPRIRNPESRRVQRAAVLCGGKSESRILESRPHNPKHRIRNPESGPQTSRTYASVQGISEPRTQNPESGIQTPASRTHGPRARRASKGHQNPEPRTRNPESGPQPSTSSSLMMLVTQNPEPRIRNPESGPQPPEPVGERPRDIRTQNPESGIRNPDRSRQYLSVSVQGT